MGLERGGKSNEVKSVSDNGTGSGVVTGFGVGRLLRHRPHFAAW